MATPPATVTVGPIPVDPGQYIPDVTGVWDDCFIESQYINPQGTYMAGLTSPGGFQGNSVAFFQLATPTLLWVVNWYVSRGVQVPDVPDPYSVTGNWKLLAVEFDPDNFEVDITGSTASYKISGTYVFGRKNPDPKVIKHVTFGRWPWIQDKFTRTISLSHLKQALAGTSTDYTSTTQGFSTTVPGS